MRKKPLFIFEMANNHSGSVDHAIKIIHAVKEVCTYAEFEYAFKLQYRDLDTFITKRAQAKSDHPTVTRFMGTRLDRNEFLTIKNEIVKCGFTAICTPFDETSVDLVVAHGYDYIKIASCSFTDWPLLERIALADKPIIASVAGATLDEIDRVVLFFKHRRKQLALMHCIGEYPTPLDNLQLNQIDLLKGRYADIPVGYSTHEDTNNFAGVTIAIAKGATLFEKHVGLPTDSIKLNAYSATPEQARRWLKVSHEAFRMCGIAGERHTFSAGEQADLWAFKRGVFAKRDMPEGKTISAEDIYFAIPKVDGQLTANDMSKYEIMHMLHRHPKDAPICAADVDKKNVREMNTYGYNKVKALLEESGVVLGNEGSYELSHHYGIERFFEYGATFIEIINKDYCKKIFVVLPRQKHPTHYHKMKAESFHVLYGTMNLTIEGNKKTYGTGDIEHVAPGQKHSFDSDTGCVVEEVSTTHYEYDSFYDDPAIAQNANRKTKLVMWDDIAVDSSKGSKSHE